MLWLQEERRGMWGLVGEPSGPYHPPSSGSTTLSPWKERSPGGHAPHQLEKSRRINSDDNEREVELGQKEEP